MMDIEEHTMPLTHELDFRVRHYECDMYGHMNHANYLRYMQEAGFDASAAAGYDLARYNAMGRYWLVRETDIEYLRPLCYGDSVRLRTWVADFHRVRSRRMYEFRKPSEEDLIARAYTEWVFVDSATGRLASIPPEMAEAYMPEGAPDSSPSREPFPTAPPPPPGVFAHRRRVEWRDLDPAGHVNNAVYMAYMEDCAIQDAASRGWPISRMMAEGGFAIVARRYRIEYKQPTLMDDELQVATWISDVKRATAVRHFTVTRVKDEALLARAHTTWVWVDPVTCRPIHIPQAFIADLPNIVGEY
jgi:acyl-CoA thioester hydrolase